MRDKSSVTEQSQDIIPTEEDLSGILGEEGEDGKEGLIKVSLGFQEDLAIKWVLTCVSTFTGLILDCAGYQQKKWKKWPVLS